MLAEPVKEMIIEDDDAMVADADTELLIATAGTDDETKKLVGKFNVTVNSFKYQGTRTAFSDVINNVYAISIKMENYSRSMKKKGINLLEIFFLCLIQKLLCKILYLSNN
jgi:hypothetical protein